MLVGQDPTIFRKPERVKCVLMLDEPGSQLRKWLEDLFGRNELKELTLYATNLVKCSFEYPPSTRPGGASRFLQPYFEKCRFHLSDELLTFRPSLVLTFGQAAHRHFISVLDNSDRFPVRMKEGFTGEFFRANHRGLEFDYSPSLHIKTFRVAETYGEKVRLLKESISSYFRREV